ncbi:MAG TPA: NAD-dependent epimerase/dehydratase family protein [Candidatus Paceibacterota bacterium]
MKVLVTGGTGFIGSNIVEALLGRGDEVVITGHDAEQSLPNFKGTLLLPSLIGIDWSALPPVDILFHEAAYNDTRSQDLREMLHANVAASLELFKRVVEKGCKHIVYASSTAVYGNGPAPYKEDQPLHPLNPYAQSKQRLEEEIARFARAHPDVVIVGLRYCNVYGPGESHKGTRASMIYQLAQQMRKGNPRLFKSGEQRRDYIYVKDVVEVNLRAAEARSSGVLNCGSGRATAFNDVVKLLNNALGTSRTPEYIDNPFTNAYQDYTECDMSRAEEVLGFVPQYSIEAGIEEYKKTGSL